MVVARQHRKVSVYEPRDYIDCKQIAQALFRKEIIILSFKLMNESSARRVVDFMTGTVYAIDGDIQRLGDEMFICTPANVDVDSSITRNIITNHLTEY
nr:cell division protein SepF [Vagococcus sp. CY53-2]